MTNQLTYQGHTYPLTDWLTYSAYCAKHDLALAALGNRISRGKIDPAHLLNVPEWGLKLIRDVGPPKPTAAG